MIKMLLSTLVRGFRRATLIAGAIGVGGLALSLLVTPRPETRETLLQQTPAPAEGWGSSAIASLEGGLRQLSPIPLANACGLGASSCFKCHNGKRAGAPTSQPWHQDHDRVNFSCAGCHGGNPRLMKEGIAHRGLVADSTSQPDKFCFKCHTGDDGSGLLNQYVASKGGKQ
ncbi:MAG: hypothetical protein P8166_01940 [Candidatus Thiodiazotropha sp.]